MSTSKHQRTSFGSMNQLDYINKLPDEVLVLILDKLPMEAVLHTSLVSKRWKDLWKSKSRIDLGYSWIQKTHKSVLPSLFEILQSHQEPRIQSISVSLRHDPSMFFEVGLLMAYAGWKDVEEIYLDMNDREDNRKRWTRRYPFVFIPQHEIGPCFSLRKLSMKFLQLETLPPLRFMALRELLLEHVMLFHDSVEKITTNCPSLDVLSLCNCNPTIDLKIIVASGSSLVHLIIKEEMTEVRSKTELFIRAANVKTVEFGLALPRKEYHLEATLQCAELTFRLNQMHHSRQALRVTSSGLRGNFSNNFLGILNDFRAGKVLTLSSWCIQVLSMEVVKFEPPQHFEVTHVTLETSLKRWEMPGISYMLLACYKLENLVIVMGDHTRLKFEYMEGYRYRGAADVVYPRALQDLTVVEFRNFGGVYQTWEDGSFDMDRFFAGYRYAGLLLWNLRTYAKNLRKMVFITKRKRYETDQFHSFGKLSYHRRLYPQFYRVPHLFIYKFDWNPEACAS